LSTFPDIEMGVLELLEPLGECYLRMPVGFEALLDDDEISALIHIADLGGVGGDEVFRTARVRVTTYGAGRDAAKDPAEAARDVLLDSPHGTEAGLLDRITAETEPVAMPYPSDRVLTYQAVYRVDVRPIVTTTKETTNA